MYAEEVPDEFFGTVSIILVAARSFRLTNYEFESKLLKSDWLSPPSERKYSNRTGSAIRIPRTMVYRFRSIGRDICISAVTKLATIILNGWPPSPLVFTHSKRSSLPIFIKLGMGAIAKKPGLGTRNWIRTRHQDRISAYFGSYEDWQAIRVGIRSGQNALRNTRLSGSWL